MNFEPTGSFKGLDGKVYHPVISKSYQDKRETAALNVMSKYLESLEAQQTGRLTPPPISDGDSVKKPPSSKKISQLFKLFGNK